MLGNNMKYKGHIYSFQLPPFIRKAVGKMLDNAQKQDNTTCYVASGISNGNITQPTTETSTQVNTLTIV